MWSGRYAGLSSPSALPPHAVGVPVSAGLEGCGVFSSGISCSGVLGLLGEASVAVAEPPTSEPC